MAWYLATIVNGIEGSTLATGRRCHFHRTPDGRVFVLGQGDITAVVTLAVACRSLRTERYADGRPIRVRNQDRQNERFWGARSGRSLVVGESRRHAA